MQKYIISLTNEQFEVVKDALKNYIEYAKEYKKIHGNIKHFNEIADKTTSTTQKLLTYLEEIPF